MVRVAQHVFGFTKWPISGFGLELVGLGIGSAELVWLELELGIGRAFIDSIRGACCRFCSGSAMLTVSSLIICHLTVV